ncbi:MAG: hypothetical protein OER86_03090 [Phycisphaerae bacterium]|nr:hypothetical protein [Phycisphaerae bacterium]
MAVVGIYEMLLVVVLGGGFSPAVFSLPPLPPDPKLLAVAPETCLFYMNWAGAAAPDPKSPNRTERFLADAEIRGFASDVERALVEAFRRGVGRDPDAAVAAQAVPLLVRTALTRPAAIYVSKFTPPAQGPPTIDGGLVIHAGDQVQVLRDRVQALARMAGAAEAAELVVEGVRLSRLPAPIKVHWGVVDQYLLLAIGETAPMEMVQALKGQRAAPRWLADLSTKLAVDRRASLTFLNTGPLLEMVARSAGPRGVAMISAIGLDRVKFLGSTTGLDDSGYLTQSLIGIEGKLTGLLSVLEAEPLAAEDLGHVAAGSGLAVAGRFDAAQGMRQFLAMLETIDPRSAREAAEGLAEFRRETGFDLSGDLLQALGTVWSVHHVASEGPAPFPGLVASVDVRDRERLNETLIRIETLLGREMRRDANIRRLDVAGGSIRFVNPTDDEIPVAPAWCLTDSHLHLALYPQVLRAYLGRAGAVGGKSAAHHPATARALGLNNAPMIVGQVDTAALVRTYYPVLYPIAAMAMGQMQREGIDLTIASLPGATVLARHLRGTSGSVRRTRDGLLIEMRGTLPLGGGMSLLTPAVLGSVTGVRMNRAGAALGAARDAEAMAHVRMLSVAAISYATDHEGKMPQGLEELAPYLDQPRGRFPRDPRTGQRWLYLAQGKHLNRVQRVAATPMFAAPRPIRGRRIVVYLDGHVENVEEHRFLAQCRGADIRVPIGEANEVEGRIDLPRDDRPVPVPGSELLPREAVPAPR